MADFYLKRGDLVPAITSTLVDADNAPIDINGATVTFVMRLMDTYGDPLIEVVAENLQVLTGTDGSKGKVRYDWQTGDTDVAGGYDAEWRVVFSDGQGTMPNNAFVTVAIMDGLGTQAP